MAERKDRAQAQPQNGETPPPRPVSVAWPPGFKAADTDPVMQMRIAAGSIAEIIDPEQIQFARVRGI